VSDGELLILRLARDKTSIVVGDAVILSPEDERLLQCKRKGWVRIWPIERSFPVPNRPNVWELVPVQELRLTDAGKTALYDAEHSLRPPSTVEAVKPQGERPKRRTGRPAKTEASSATVTLSALCLWHGYGDGGSVSNPEAATNNGLADWFNSKTRDGDAKLPNNALHRFLKGHGGTKKYKVSCVSGKIGMLLKSWRGELLNDHSELFSDE
jgi:hypothetical protein